MYSHHTPSPPTAAEPIPTGHKPIRQECEERGVKWAVDPGFKRLYRHPDYPDGRPSLRDLLQDAVEVEYHGTAATTPPPACNTGVENSQGIDYVSLTCPYDATGCVFYDVLRIPADEWQELAHGGHGYKRCRECGGVRVYYDGKEGMGSYCQVSGDGCRELEARGSIRDWQEFAILTAHTYGLKCKRLDPMRDDRQGLLDMEAIKGKLDRGECSTHAQDWQSRGKCSVGGDGERKGDTIEIGSRQSDSFMRIYNKALELVPRGVDRQEWLQEHGHHVRVELELKGKRAQAAWERFASTGFGEGFIPGLLCGFIEFREHKARGHNGTRVPRWEAWDLFLKGEAKAQLAVHYVKQTLEKAQYFLERQWGAFIATFVMLLGGDVEQMSELFMGIALRGRVRMKPKHYRLLADAMAA